MKSKTPKKFYCKDCKQVIMCYNYVEAYPLSLGYCSKCDKLVSELKEVSNEGL